MRRSIIGDIPMARSYGMYILQCVLCSRIYRRILDFGERNICISG